MVSRRIEPKLRRDYLRELPIELALHCLSFVSSRRLIAHSHLPLHNTSSIRQILHQSQILHQIPPSSASNPADSRSTRPKLSLAPGKCRNTGLSFSKTSNLGKT